MPSSKLRTGLLITEVVVCFALPAYLLFWGVITAPAWLFAAMRGGTYALWTLAYDVGGCLGIVAIVAFLRYVTSSSDERKFAAVRNTAFAVAGLASIWGTVTDNFRSVDVDPFTFMAAIVPSLCFVHFLILALRKSGARRSGDRSLDRTRSGAGVD